MAFNIPNQASASFARQAAWHSSDIDALVAAFAGDGVLSGLAVTAQGTPDMTVAVAAGQVRIGGYFPYFTAANATISAADSTNPRIDLVSIDYNGTVTVTAGTAASAPVAPALPANSVPLAQVYVSAGVTSIGSSRIIDKRVVVPDSYDVTAECLGFSTSGTAATASGSVTEACFAVTANGTYVLANSAGSSAHPGILSVSTGGTSGNDTRLHFGAAATDAAVAPANLSRLKAVLQISTAVTTMRLKFGAGQDISDVASDTWGTAGAWWEFNSNDSNKWQTETRQASTTTTNTDTGADVAQSTWYQLEIIRLQNGNWQFIKNGVILFTHSANQPTTACNVGFVIETNTAAARTFLLDFFGLNFGPLGQRYT